MRAIWRYFGIFAMAITLILAIQASASAQPGFSAGIGSIGNDSRSMFNLFGSQGSSRGLGMMSSSVTSMNGQPGYFAAGTLQPFVTGVTPIVGEERRFLSSGHHAPEVAGPPMTSLSERVARLRKMGEALGSRRTEPAPLPAEEKPAAPKDLLANDRSTAAAPAGSLAAIRREREAAKAAGYRVAADHFAQAAAAERDGKHALAAYHYKIARRDGDEKVRRAAQEQLDQLAAKGVR
jgi:hypothetical protein